MSWTASGDLVLNIFGDDRYYEGTISVIAATIAAARFLCTWRLWPHKCQTQH